MTTLINRLSPTAVMLLAAAIATVLTSCAIWLSLERPYLDLPEAATPVVVGEVVLQQTDALSEPDVLGIYPKMTDFFARQI